MHNILYSLYMWVILRNCVPHVCFLCYTVNDISFFLGGIESNSYYCWLHILITLAILILIAFWSFSIYLISKSKSAFFFQLRICRKNKPMYQHFMFVGKNRLFSRTYIFFNTEALVFWPPILCCKSIVQWVLRYDMLVDYEG